MSGGSHPLFPTKAGLSKGLKRLSKGLKSCALEKCFQLELPKCDEYHGIKKVWKYMTADKIRSFRIVHN